MVKLRQRALVKKVCAWQMADAMLLEMRGRKGCSKRSRHVVKFQVEEESHSSEILRVERWRLLERRRRVRETELRVKRGWCVCELEKLRPGI